MSISILQIIICRLKAVLAEGYYSMKMSVCTKQALSSRKVIITCGFPQLFKGAILDKPLAIG